VCASASGPQEEREALMNDAPEARRCNKVMANSFGKAMAEHLGLDPKRVTLVVIEGRSGTLLTAQVTVAINADDLASVAGRMREGKR